jgi:hypothetical protein
LVWVAVEVEETVLSVVQLMVCQADQVVADRVGLVVQLEVATPHNPVVPVVDLVTEAEAVAGAPVKPRPAAAAEPAAAAQLQHPTLVVQAELASNTHNTLQIMG